MSPHAAPFQLDTLPLDITQADLASPDPLARAAQRRFQSGYEIRTGLSLEVWAGGMIDARFRLSWPARWLLLRHRLGLARPATISLHRSFPPAQPEPSARHPIASPIASLTPTPITPHERSAA